MMDHPAHQLMVLSFDLVLLKESSYLEPMKERVADEIKLYNL